MPQMPQRTLSDFCFEVTKDLQRKAFFSVSVTGQLYSSELGQPEKFLISATWPDTQEITLRIDADTFSADNGPAQVATKFIALLKNQTLKVVSPQGPPKTALERLLGDEFLV